MLAHQPIHVQSSTQEKTSNHPDFTILYLTPTSLFEGDALSAAADILCIQEIYTDPADIYDLFKSHYAHFLYIPPTPTTPGTLLISKYTLTENPDSTFTLHNDTTPLADIQPDLAINPIQPSTITSTKRTHGPHTETLTTVKHLTKKPLLRKSAKYSQRKSSPRDGVILCRDIYADDDDDQRTNKNNNRSDKIKSYGQLDWTAGQYYDSRGKHSEAKMAYTQKHGEERSWDVYVKGTFSQDNFGSFAGGVEIGGTIDLSKD